MTHLLGQMIADVRIVDAWSLREAARRLYPLTKLVAESPDDRETLRARLRLRRKWLRARLKAPAHAKPIYATR